MTNTTNDSKIALVTGSSRGLGRSMVENLAAAGVDSIVTYRTEEGAAREVVDAIRAKGRRAVALRLDVADIASFDAFADAVRSELRRTFGRERFDYLVNNAGSGLYASFMETTVADLDRQVDIHFKSTFFLSQKLLPIMNDGGRIVNVTTGLTRYSYPGSSVYAAMKGAVEVLGRHMAQELGPRRITVNSVAPGGIVTDFGGGMLRDPGLQKMVADGTALGRIGQPDDVGAVVAMLLSPGAGWINGQRIELTGGMNL